MPTNHAGIFQALADPFEPSELKIRDGAGGKSLSYITARTAMNRLDRVLGPENWRDSYRPSGLDGERSLVCRLEIRVGDEWLGKEGIGGRADMKVADDDDKSADAPRKIRSTRHENSEISLNHG